MTSGGACGVDLTSTATGITAVHANWTGGIVTPEGTALAAAQSNNAVKHWTDARLTIDPPKAADQIGDTHTFHAHLQFDLGSGFVDAPSGATIYFTKDAGPGALSPSSCTTDDAGSCSVHLTSSATGVTTVHASWGGRIQTPEGTASASITSGSAAKSWVDAKLVLSPSDAANQINVTHHLTATLTFDHGDGHALVSAPDGSAITFSRDAGPGSLSAPSCRTTGGSCVVDLTSSVTGLTTVQASWSGSISTTNGSASASATSSGATKLWTDARLTLTPPTAVNRIGDLHVFTARLEFDKGTGTFVPAPDGETINVTKSSGPGSLSAASCTTSSGTGACTVALQSLQTGTTEVQASWNGFISTAHGDAAAVANGSADKNWVDALITINPPAA